MDYSILKQNLQNISESVTEEIYERIPNMGNRDLSEALNACINAMDKIHRMERTDISAVTNAENTAQPGKTIGVTDFSKMSKLLLGS